MAGGNVPKFGNWESQEDVPYTAYFDKARKVRTSGGKMINPNDPEENMDLYSQAPPPSRSKPEQEEPVRRSRERMRSREDSEFKQFAESHAPRAGGGRPHEANNKRQGRTASAAGSENNSYDRSPLHNQPRTPGRSVGAPSVLGDASKNSYDGTGRSKPRSNNRGDESPDRGMVVPRFGDWDENNPSSADGYTHIFNKVREERNLAGTGTGSSRTPSHQSSKPPPDSTKCCCFSWGGK